MLFRSRFPLCVRSVAAHVNAHFEERWGRQRESRISVEVAVGCFEKLSITVHRLGSFRRASK